ncbi:MAG: DUF2958 domain-containing protein [Lachnospiraceae bacterium]|nr:DUF2958 domain-containing protein [Lachnospiraceae bacterium]
MKLMKKCIEKKFERFPIGSQTGKGMDAEVVVKYFNPDGCGIWLITEGEELWSGDWKLYGYCYTLKWSWRYVMLSELESFRASSFGDIRRVRYIGKHSKIKDLI